MSMRSLKPTLANPLDPPEKVEFTIPGEIARATGPYAVSYTHLTLPTKA